MKCHDCGAEPAKEKYYDSKEGKIIVCKSCRHKRELQRTANIRKEEPR